MENRSNLLLLFLLAITAPLAWLTLSIAIPRILTDDNRNVWVVAGGVFIVGALVVMFGALIFVIGARWMKRRVTDSEYGVTPPVCRGCGYDLRSSPYLCPECGTPVNRMDRTIIQYLMSLRRRDQIDQMMLSDRNG